MIVRPRTDNRLGEFRQRGHGIRTPGRAIDLGTGFPGSVKLSADLRIVRGIALSAACLLFFLSGPGSSKTSIQFWAVTSSIGDVQMYRHLADDFERETGIAVDMTPLSWGNFASKYFTAMAAGLPPDIGITNNGGPVDYGSVGGLMDFREEFPEEIEAFENLFFPKLLPQYVFKDRLFGIPTAVTTLVLYYRTDIFQRLNIAPPQTWSELLQTIHRLEANGYHYGFAWTRPSQWALSLYTKPFGLDAFEQTSGGDFKIHYTDPEYIEGVSFAMELWHMHDLADPNLGDKYLGLFSEDHSPLALPLLLDLSYTHTRIPQIAPGLAGKWGVLPWPRADRGEPYNVMGGTAYVIFRKSERKREAFEWLKYLNRVEVQQRIILDRLSRKEESFFTFLPFGPSGVRRNPISGTVPN
jgi:ABC-type glycerol-3-phosphate transport system substrate-binding protein